PDPVAQHVAVDRARGSYGKRRRNAGLSSHLDADQPRFLIEAHDFAQALRRIGAHAILADAQLRFLLGIRERMNERLLVRYRGPVSNRSEAPEALDIVDELLVGHIAPRVERPP